MKQFTLLLLMLSGLMLYANGQEVSDKIKVEELIKIIDSGNFSLFKKLVASVKYPLADSAGEDNGSITYITREHKPTGNTLGVSLTKKMTVSMLSFSTYSKPLYEKLKKEIRQNQFISQGFNKEAGDRESEDFEKGKIYIATSAIAEGNRPFFYEFFFFKMR